MPALFPKGCHKESSRTLNGAILAERYFVARQTLLRFASLLAALVFDITPPILCGLPMCNRLELQGDPVESGELVVQWAYSGGQESGSTFQWTRISPTGKETLLPVCSFPAWWFFPH